MAAQDWLRPSGDQQAMSTWLHTCERTSSEHVLRDCSIESAAVSVARPTSQPTPLRRFADWTVNSEQRMSRELRTSAISEAVSE